MKDAEEWVRYMGCGQSHWDKLKAIRRIQADAIRWAANLSGNIHRVAALVKADELDPPEPNNPS